MTQIDAMLDEFEKRYPHRVEEPQPGPNGVMLTPAKPIEPESITVTDKVLDAFMADPAAKPYLDQQAQEEVWKRQPWTDRAGDVVKNASLRIGASLLDVATNRAGRVKREVDAELDPRSPVSTMGGYPWEAPPPAWAVKARHTGMTREQVVQDRLNQGTPGTLDAVSSGMRRAADLNLAGNARPFDLSSPDAGTLVENIIATVPYMAATTAAFMATGPTGAALVAFAVESDDAYRSALENGATVEQAEIAGTITGAANAMIETFQVSGWVRFGKDTAKQQLAREIGRRATAKILAGKAARLAFEEGLEEMMQGAAGDLTAWGVYGKPPEDFWQNRAVEGIIGSVAGLGMGGAGRVANALTRGQQQAQPAPVAPEATPEVAQTPTEVAREVAQTPPQPPAQAPIGDATATETVTPTPPAAPTVTEPAIVEPQSAQAVQQGTEQAVPEVATDAENATVPPTVSETELAEMFEPQPAAQSTTPGADIEVSDAEVVELRTKRVAQGERWLAAARRSPRWSQDDLLDEIEAALTKAREGKSDEFFRKEIQRRKAKQAAQVLSNPEQLTPEAPAPAAPQPTGRQQIIDQQTPESVAENATVPPAVSETEMVAPEVAPEPAVPVTPEAPAAQPPGKLRPHPQFPKAQPGQNSRQQIYDAQLRIAGKKEADITVAGIDVQAEKLARDLQEQGWDVDAEDIYANFLVRMGETAGDLNQAGLFGDDMGLPMTGQQRSLGIEKGRTEEAKAGTIGVPLRAAVLKLFLAKPKISAKDAYLALKEQYKGQADAMFANPANPMPEINKALDIAARGDPLPFGGDSTPAVTVTPQPRPDRLFQGARAAVTFDGLKATVTLFRGADATSIIHEFFHYNIRIRQAMGLLTDAETAALQKAYGVSKWTPAKVRAEAKRLGIERAAVRNIDALRNIVFQERMALGFEQYLRDGRAPTPALKKLFERIKQMFAAVYGEAKRLAMVNRDVRAVFDRMLGATETLDDKRQQARIDKTTADIEARMVKWYEDCVESLEDMRERAEAGDMEREQYGGNDRFTLAFAGPYPGEVRDWLRGKTLAERKKLYQLGLRQNVKGGMAEDYASGIGGYDELFSRAELLADPKRQLREQAVQWVLDNAPSSGDPEGMALVEAYKTLQKGEDIADLDAYIADQAEQAMREQGGEEYQGGDPFADLIADEPAEMLFQGGKDATPEEFETTSTKRRLTTRDREARGREVIPTPKPQTFAGWVAQARAAIKEDPDLPKRLIAQQATNPQVLSAVEQAAVQIYRRELYNNYNAAAERMFKAADNGDDLARAEAQRAVEDYDAQLNVAEELTAQANSEAGRALAAIRIELKKDFSLAAMTRRVRIAKGGYALTAAELARVRQDYAEIKAKNDELTAALAEAAETIRKLEVRKLIRQTVKAAKPTPVEGVAITPAKARPPARPRMHTPERVAQAKLNIKQMLAARGGSLSQPGVETLYQADIASDDAALVAELAIAGSEFIDAKPNMTFKAWQAAMSEALGAEVSEFLPAAWTRLQRDLATNQLPAATQALAEAIVAGNKIGDLARSVRELARQFVASGITSREALIDAVHGVLQSIDTTITRSQAMDAISGYGDYKLLTKDEISVRLRELKGEMQQLAKLRDMANKQAPLKTGMERRTPTDEERQLIKKVNEAKKAGGYNVTDPAKQLRTALDATKTRLRNQIADYAQQIATRQRTIKERRATPQDAETRLLKAQRDELRKQYIDIFGTRELSDAARVQRAIAAVEKSIQNLEERIAKNQPYPAKKESRTPQTPELLAIRARRDQLKLELEALKDPAEAYNRAYEARATRQIADLQERLARGDYETAKRPDPPELTPKNKTLFYELDKLKRRHHEGLIKLRWQQASVGQKIVGIAREALNLPRAFKASFDVSAPGRQGFIYLVTHPIKGAKGIPAMFKALVSEQKAYELDKEIRNRPNYALAKRAGLPLTEIDGKLASQEEVYMSRLASSIPGIKQSERAYVAFLNKARMDLFDTLIYSLAKNGKPTLDEAKAIARYVGDATGRGHAGKFTESFAKLNSVFFSPRLMLSRFNILLGVPMWRGSWRTRKLIAKEYAKLLIGLGIMYAIARLFGADVEDDPRSSDFGKILISERTRIDPLAGLSQTAVFAARTITGETKSISGNVRPIRGDDIPYGGDDWTDVAKRFFRSKLNPVVGFAVDVTTGQNLIGEPVDPLTATATLPIPLAGRDVYESIKAEGVPTGAALGLLGMFGIGVQTIDERERKTATTRSRRRSRWR